jgi:Tol biopolymer transport system component
MAILRGAGGQPIATLTMDSRVRMPAWAGDSSALSYVTEQDGIDVMVKWSVRGGTVSPLFRFRQGRIASFRWLRNGRTVLFTARTPQAVNLWTWSVGSSEPRQLTRFPSGSVFAYSCSTDGKTTYFSQGYTTNDIVLIRGIK